MLLPVYIYIFEKKTIIFFVVLITLCCLFSSCSKQDERIEMDLIVNIWNGCNPSKYNTAIIKLNTKEYTFNLERVDGAYMSTNTILIYPGKYNVELMHIEGVKAHDKQNGLGGAVVIPKSYQTDYFQDDSIRMQVFCD